MTHDLDAIIDDCDLIDLYRSLRAANDARQHIVYDALYRPGSHIERKMAYDWVRRDKLMRGLSGVGAVAMNEAVGALRRLSQSWHNKNRLFDR